jgi:ClpP class serine protease
METVAQGRVWSGQDAFSRGLVDSVGGLSQALAIAKQKANIPKDKKVCSTIKTQCILIKFLCCHSYEATQLAKLFMLSSFVSVWIRIWSITFLYVLIFFYTFDIVLFDKFARCIVQRLQ